MRPGEPRATVIVVEDEPAITEMIRDVLTSRGFAVSSAHHGCQLAELDPYDPPDLILLDILLPNVGGDRLARILRQKGFAHTPIVAMSADNLLLHLAGRSGLFQDTLPKPFDIRDLIACVERHAGMYVT